MNEGHNLELKFEPYDSSIRADIRDKFTMRVFGPNYRPQGGIPHAIFFYQSIELDRMEMFRLLKQMAECVGLTCLQEPVAVPYHVCRVCGHSSS